MGSRMIRQPPARRLADTMAYLLLRLRRLGRRLAHQKASPRSIALGAALGTLIAFTPTFGVQMLMGIAAAAALRCSKFAALVMVYITNPFTLVPVYMFTYKVGVWLTGQRPLVHYVRVVLNHVRDQGWGQALVDVFRFGWQIALPLWVGGLAVGLVCAVIVYPVVLRLVEGHRLVMTEKRQRRQLRRLERMKMAAGLSTTGDPADQDVKIPEPTSPPPRTAAAQDRAIEVDAEET